MAINSILNLVSTIFILFMFVAYIASFICVTIHMYKFIRSKPPQSLTIKNLTFYTFILFLYYVHYFIMMIYLKVNKNGILEPMLYAIKTDLTLITMCLKFIMAIDICLCFRKIALYLQSSPQFDTKKFIIYCLTGSLPPSLLVIITNITKVLFKYDGEPILIWAGLVIPIIRLVPIFCSIWYLRKNTVDRNELWKNFALQMRLFVLIGGFSSIIDFCEMIFIVITNVWGFRGIGGVDIHNTVITVMQYGIFVEGVAIAVAFTFKADTLKPVGRKPSCTTTETFTVNVKC